ncbi:MAG TPA: DUF3429 family protein [Usitatibacter sp.]|jgi:hypothetical protein|nr:DUF3429 family protein [Usitatibacter sp.]
MRALAWAMALGTALVMLALAGVMFFATRSAIRVPAIAAFLTLVTVQLAFMGGLQAGCALAGERLGRPATLALLLGWIAPLGAFGIFWLRSTGQQLACALALFIVAFAIDAWLVRRALLPRWFLAVRGVFTLLACAATALALWLA